MISKSDAIGTTQYAWDFENRLVQVVTPSSGSVSYKYDALGRRIQRAPSSGISTNFIYDGQDVVKDINSDGSTIEYLNGPGIDNKIRQKSGTTFYYFAQDHLGSTTALTDSKGALVERQTYDAYGNSAGSAKTRYGFSGRERDALTGLLYYRARFYDPQLGRFISEDPIGLAGGINSFAYVRNNPARFTDPSGLCPQKPVPAPGPDPTEHYSLTPCNKSRLAPYFPGVDLDKVQIRFGFDALTKLTGAALDAVGIQVLSGATAITVGNVITFRSRSDYNPDSIQGIALIGHEITHVGQYQSGRFSDVQYAREYLELRRLGYSDYEAYKHISFEAEAFKKEDVIKRDLTNLRKQLGGDAFWAPCPPH